MYKDFLVLISDFRNHYDDPIELVCHGINPNLLSVWAGGSLGM